jgi:hypothetical protein
MREFLTVSVEADRAAAELQRATERVNRLEEQRDALRRIVEGSVDPVCGSATKPNIRTFSHEGKTLVVLYDHVKHAGVIAVVTNEQAAE